MVKQKPFPVKIFSDSRYGSKEKAKQAAIRYRDQRSPNLKHPPVHATNSLNTSGKIGVSKYLSTAKKEHVGWIAFWWEGNKQINVRFTFKKYGHLAYKKAVECREQAEQRLESAVT